MYVLSINLLLMPTIMAKIDAIIILQSKLHAHFYHIQSDNFSMEK